MPAVADGGGAKVTGVDVRGFELSPQTEPDAVRSMQHSFKVNPFETETPWTWRDRLGAIPMTPIFLFRVALLVTAVVVASVVIIASAPLPARYRKVALWPMRWCSRLILLAFGFWWISEEGLGRYSRDEAGIICAAPHVSLLDVFYFTYRWQPSFVAKKDILSMPFIGWFAKTMNAIFVDRRADAQTKASYIETMRRIAEDVTSPPVLIFPEGTCTNGRVLLTFKRGAFDPGLNILPVCLQYTCRISPAAVGKNGGLKFLIRIMYQWSNKLSVWVLPTYRPTEREKEDSVEFAGNLQETMGRALAIPHTRHSLADMWFYQKVVDDNLPEDTFQFVFADLYEYFDLRDGDERREFRLVLTKLLERWHGFDTNSDGVILEEEFLEYAQDNGIQEGIARVLFVQFARKQRGEVEFLDLAATCFALRRLARFVVSENPKGIGEREVCDAFRFYRGSHRGVPKESVTDLLKVGCGLELPEGVVDTYYADCEDDEGLSMEVFERLYREHKAYLKLPFAIASVLVNSVLDVAEWSSLGS